MPDTITLLGSLAGLDLQAVVGHTVWVRVHYAPDGKLLGGTEPPGTVLGEPGYAPTGYGSTRPLVTDEQGLFGGVLPWEDGGIYAVDVPGDVTRYLMMGTGAGEHPAGSTVNVRLLPGPDEVVTPSVALDALVGEAVEDYLAANPPAGGGGATDHGALTGLGDDDHPQYLNNARGDLRYAALATTYTKTETDGRIADVINAAPAALDTLAELATALGNDANYAATVTTALAGKVAKASNLSDLANVAGARTNLGLGGAAVLDVGTAAGQVAAGNDSRIIAGSLGRLAGINAQTGTAYTLALSDEGKLVTLTNAAAITLTVPTNATAAFPVGARVDLAAMGAGMVTIVGASGVTVSGTPSLVTRAQYSAVSLVKTATDAWLAVGDLA